MGFGLGFDLGFGLGLGLGFGLGLTSPPPPPPSGDGLEDELGDGLGDGLHTGAGFWVFDLTGKGAGVFGPAKEKEGMYKEESISYVYILCSCILLEK